MSIEVVGKRRLLDPRQSFVVEPLRTHNGVRRRKRLVVIDHQRHIVADHAAHRAHDLDVFAHARIADLRFDAFEPALGPLRRDAGGTLRAVVAGRTVCRDRLRRRAEQLHERKILGSRERVPKRHIDRRHCDPGQPLRTEQAEARRQKSLDGQRRDGLSGNERLERLDEECRGPERELGIAKHIAVADDALIGQDIGQYEWRLHDRAARGSMRLDHRNLDRAHPKRADCQCRFGHVASAVGLESLSVPSGRRASLPLFRSGPAPRSRRAGSRALRAG